MKEVLYKTCGVTISIGSVFAGLYVGLWKMFIMPMISIVSAIEAGAFTGSLAFNCIIKILFSSSVGVIIAAIGLEVGFYLYNKN